MAKVRVCSLFGAGFLTLWCFTACTKKSSSKNTDQPNQSPITTSNQPTTPQTSLPATPVPLYRYSLSFTAGEAIFCQDFLSQSEFPVADVESMANVMAVAQAQVPSGVVNPLNPKTLGLTLKPSGCTLIPDILKDGHCAVSMSSGANSGRSPVTSEQRLLWKDLPVLVQASTVKAIIDTKNNSISSKNELFKSLQKQITQQQQILQLIQAGQQVATGQPSQLLEQAQELMVTLQDQAKNLENDVKRLEEEIIPVQSELNKTLEKLTASRAALQQSCTPSGMGTSTAEWKAN
jgi:hypothetical protein